MTRQLVLTRPQHHTDLMQLLAFKYQYSTPSSPRHKQRYQIGKFWGGGLKRPTGNLFIFKEMNERVVYYGATVHMHEARNEILIWHILGD